MSYNHTVTVLLLAAPTAIALSLTPACDSCNGRVQPQPDPPPVTTTSSSTAAPEPPQTAWAVVETLGSVADRWGTPPDTEGAWALIERGKTPYPWRVTFATDEDQSEYDCGVYEQLTYDWRVAYCKGGSLDGPRQALRLTLHVKPDSPEQLRIWLSETDVELILGRQ